MYWQVIVLRIFDMACFMKGHLALLDPLQAYVCAQAARHLSPDAWIKAIIRFGEHLRIPMKITAFCRREDKDNMINIAKRLSKA
jgi:hypothetical protein